MKAITLWQPYASLMAAGIKRNETRGRLTHYRGDLVICSAKREMNCDEWPQALKNVVYDNAEKLMVQIGQEKTVGYGYALCIVEVCGCITSEEFVGNTLSMTEFVCGDYSPGRFAWQTRNLRRLKEPVPVKGAQGFFNLPPDVAAKVRSQI